jgi:antitoxin ParD1/3/4
MTVKSTVSFTDRHHQFARQKVDDGIFGSVSSLVALGIEQLMQDETEREVALNSMAETIRHRMKTPRSAWVAVEENDPVFEKARQRLGSK